MARELGLKTFSVDLIRKGADLKMSFIAPGIDRGISLASKLFFLRRFASHTTKKRKSFVKKILRKLVPFHVFQHEVAVVNTVKAVKSGYRFGITWFMETDAASHLFGPESFEGAEGKPFLYDSVEDDVIDADSELEKLYRKIEDYKPVFSIVSDHGHSTVNCHISLWRSWKIEG
ncbi:alkaline phosphatase family protein [Ferroglobus placidus]|uniref:alkaline phosphatase family protein n=1 Tax=Ferroglobus placidus TaxID=54261 RepID=UPI0001B770BD|nr:alkaline phosphatase family protein [Ferroglobus placidus]